MKKDNEQTLGEAIRSFLSAYNLEDKYLEKELFSRWDELAGRQINVKTKKLVFKDGILVVHLSSSTLRQELSMRKAEMLEKLNLRLKGQPIREIRFK